MHQKIGNSGKQYYHNNELIFDDVMHGKNNKFSKFLWTITLYVCTKNVYY